MRSSTSKKKPRGNQDDEKSSFKSLGGRQSSKSSGRGQNGEESEGGDEGTSMADRAGSGLKAAKHLSKAADGGPLRQVFSLWRASKHLGTAAAGTGELVKKYPALSAAVGGVAVAGTIYFLAARAASAASEESDEDADAEDQSGDEGEEEQEEDEGAEGEEDAEEEAEEDE